MTSPQGSGFRVQGLGFRDASALVQVTIVDAPELSVYPALSFEEDLRFVGSGGHVGFARKGFPS